MRAPSTQAVPSSLKVPQTIVFSVSGPNTAWKTCGKPVGTALKSTEQAGVFCESFGLFATRSKTLLNNRGQLSPYRQVLHSFFDFIHTKLEAITAFIAVVYDNSRRYCPRGSTPLKITIS